MSRSRTDPRLPIPKPSSEHSDEDLVAACLKGSAQAWEALLGKYKKLIYSIPLRYHLSLEDAADIFQNVCLDLYRQMEDIRNAGAIRGWLVRAAVNRSIRVKERANRLEPLGPGWDDSLAIMPEWAAELERDQAVREGILTLTPRCRELIRMLFFEVPPRPYDRIASELGLATGSIGFIRGRCLNKLATALREAGLK